MAARKRKQATTVGRQQRETPASKASISPAVMRFPVPCVEQRMRDLSLHDQPCMRELSKLHLCVTFVIVHLLVYLADLGAEECLPNSGTRAEDLSETRARRCEICYS